MCYSEGLAIVPKVHQAKNFTVSWDLGRASRVAPLSLQNSKRWTTTADVVQKLLEGRGEPLLWPYRGG